MSRRPLVLYLALAFGVSWALWIPAVLGLARPLGFDYAAALGPAVGALGAVGAQGRLPAWFRRRLAHPGPGRLWAALVGGFVGLGALGFGLEALFTGAPGSLQGLGVTAELPGWSPWAVAALVTLSYGFFEEWGWRGWLFPHWAKSLGGRRAALAVGVVWALWHAPAFAFNPTYQALGPAVAGWVASLMAGSLVLSALVVRAQGRLGPVVLWHALFDFVTVSDASATFLTPVFSVAALALVPWAWRVLAPRSQKA